jgi:hypothetical protein
MNVETLRRRTQSSMRYSFDAQARRQWSFEHIHAQNSQGLSTVEQWTAWLDEHREALDALNRPEPELAALTERIDKTLPTISSETFEPLHRDVTRLFSAEDHAGDPDDPGARDHSEVDAITNLALLARDDNSVLSKCGLRGQATRDHRTGPQRLLHPGLHAQRLPEVLHRRGRPAASLLGPRDRQDYLDAMLDALGPYLLEDVPENGSPEDPDDPEESQA